MRPAEEEEEEDLPGLEALDDVDDPPEAVEGVSGRVYSSTSIFCLRVTDEPRKTFIRIVEQPLFDPIILLTILCNCTTMAWESPLDPPGTPKAAFIDVCEWVYLYIFTFELVSKIIAYGFLMHEGSYLRDAWCQLDFIVVTLAWIPILFPSFGNYSVIRSVRALRPLRALKRMPGMPVMINSLLAALPKLGDVGFLCSLLVVVLGIVGTEEFKGTLHYRCALPGYVEPEGHPSIEDIEGRRLSEPTSPAELVARMLFEGSSALFDESSEAAWSSARQLSSIPGRMLKGAGGGGIPMKKSNNSVDEFDTFLWCDPEAERDVCTFGEGGDPAQSCMYFEENSNFGVTTMDTFGWTSIAILQAITFDSWTVPMYALMRATSSPFVIVFFFLIIVVVGGFFIVNLFLAVLFQEFVEAQAIEAALAEEKKRKAERKSFRLSRSNSPSSPMLDELEEPSSALIPKTPTVAISDDAAADEEAGGGDGGSGKSFCDCAPPAGHWRSALGEICNAAWFGNMSTGLVLFNLALMCMPYYGMTEEYAANLESAATFVSWLFIIEMALKLTAFGCTGYWSDNWNVLDGSIVIMSIVEMVLTAIFAGSGVKLSFLRILRMLRIARMLRLMKSWKGLYKIIMTTVQAIPQMSNVFILLFLVTMIFALLGMQIFGGQFTEENGYGDYPLVPLPRYNFDYFVPAMLTVFILATGGWVTPMLHGVNAIGPGAAAYFVIVVLIGTYVLMNLLVAVLLQLFAEPEDDTASNAGSAPPSPSKDANEEEQAAEAPTDADDVEKGAQEDVPTPIDPNDVALNMYPPDHPTRRMCAELIESPTIDSILMVAVIVSSALLALDSPRLAPDSLLSISLRLCNYGFTALFLWEAVSKSIAYGFVSTPKAYLKVGWNVLDFALLLISVGAILSEILPQLSFLRSLRALRVLRPLRLLSRNEGMKLTLTSLVEALPAVSNVFGVLLALQLVFAILGMQIFSGSFGSCTDLTILDPKLCVGEVLPEGESASPPPPALTMLGGSNETFADIGISEGSRRQLKGHMTGAFVGPRVWQNPKFGSFDDFGQAMLLLLVMSTGDDWDTVMFWAMDSVGPDQPRVRNDSSGASIFFIAWMFVGCFFAMQLFVGVVVDQFNRIRAEKDGSATMTEEQKQWVESMRTMGNTKLKAKPVLGPNDSGIKVGVFHILRSDYFYKFMDYFVIFNIVVLCSDHWGFAGEEGAYTFETYESILHVINYVYYAEAALKIYAFGFNFYWNKDDWCFFEGILIILAVVNQLQVVQFISKNIIELSPLLARAVAASRAMRALRLVQHAKGLQSLLTTIFMSIPSLLNVSSLLLLVVFIYSVLGVQLFTYVQRGFYFTSQRNFDTFTNALLANFQCLTGDGWSSLMHEALKDEEHGSTIAIPFFVSFQVLCSSVILNLVVAVILDNFTSLGGGNSDLVSRADIELFSEVWSDFDPDADHKIPVSMLPDLMKAIPQPLGLQGAPRSWVVRVCLNFGLEAKDGQFNFKDVLGVLVKFNFQQQMKDALPPPSETAAAAMKEAGESNVSKAGAGSSLLWSGEVTKEKRVVAKTFAMELLKLSHGTSHFRKTVALPRDLRIQQMMKNLASWEGKANSPSFSVADIANMARSFKGAGKFDVLETIETATLKADDASVAALAVLRTVSPIAPIDETPRRILRRVSVQVTKNENQPELDDVAVKATAAALNLYTRLQQRIATLNEQIQTASESGDTATVNAMREQTDELRQQLVDNVAMLSEGGADVNVLSPPPAAIQPSAVTPSTIGAVKPTGGALSYTGLSLMFKLEGELDTFTTEMEQAFLERLASFGGAPTTQLVVMKKRAGSVILEVAVLHSYDAPDSALEFVSKIEAAGLDEISDAVGCDVVSKSVSGGPFAPEAAAPAPVLVPAVAEETADETADPPSEEMASASEEKPEEETAAPAEEVDPEVLALWNVYNLTAESDADTAASAEKVQAIFRGHKERAETQVLKRQKTDATVKMQSNFRGKAARAEVDDKRAKAEAARMFEQMEADKAALRAKAEAAVEEAAAKAAVEAAAARAAAEARAAVEAEAARWRAAEEEAARRAAEEEAIEAAAAEEAAKRAAVQTVHHVSTTTVTTTTTQATPPTAKPVAAVQDGRRPSLVGGRRPSLMMGQQEGDELLQRLQSHSDDFLSRLQMAEDRDTEASKVGTMVTSGAELDETRALARQRRSDCRDCGVCGICAVPRFGKEAPPINMAGVLAWNTGHSTKVITQGSNTPSRHSPHRRPTGERRETPKNGRDGSSRRQSSKRAQIRQPQAHSPLGQD